MPSDESKEKIIEKIKRFSDVRIVGLLVFGVIVLLVTWSGIQVMQKNYDLEKREAELRAKNEVKKLENENLKLKNTYFGTNQYLELTTRRQFNKAAPGEKLYLIPESVARSKTVDLPEPKAPASAEEKEASKSKYQQNFENWLDFLFNRN